MKSFQTQTPMGEYLVDEPKLQKVTCHICWWRGSWCRSRWRTYIYTHLVCMRTYVPGCSLKIMFVTIRVDKKNWLYLVCKIFLNRWMNAFGSWGEWSTFDWFLKYTSSWICVYFGHIHNLRFRILEIAPGYFYQMQH